MFIQLPSDIVDHVDISSLPVCGVITTAIVAGVTFTEAYQYYKAREHPRWKGSLSIGDINKGIKAFGVKTSLSRALTNRYSKKPFRKFLTENALVDPYSVYVVYTNRHVQVVQGHRVLDQQGVGTNASYWGLRRHVISIYKVDEKTIGASKENTMNTKVTKYSRAVEIVQRLKNEDKTRKEILFALTTELDTTWRSASTFYHRVTRELNKEKEAV